MSKICKICIGTLGVFALAACTSGNRTPQYASITDSVVTDTTTAVQQNSESAIQSEVQDEPHDFISGGNTYVGTRVKDVEMPSDFKDFKKGDMVKFKTHYTIKCYKDGSMTWSEDTSENGGEPSHKKFDGEWKKVTVSKHDVVYTWYEFWATAYDLQMNSHYTRLGFIDEKGQLYFEGAEPEEEIPANSTTFVICKVSAQ